MIATEKSHESHLAFTSSVFSETLAEMKVTKGEYGDIKNGFIAVHVASNFSEH